MFRFNEFTNVGLQHIASLPSLTKLSLRCFSGISDDGARYLGSVKSLRVLSLLVATRSQSETLTKLDFSHNTFFVFLI